MPRPRSRVKKKPRYFKCAQCRGYFPVSEKEEHICTPPTEWTVMGHLEGDLLDTWEKLREFAADLGEQRIYASTKAVMFSTRVCYCFVRPRSKDLQLFIMLPKRTKHERFKKIVKQNKKKWSHYMLLKHPDEISNPVTGWLEEAFAASNNPST